jgi:ribosomal protein S18 acetylase RimI-like enzyme
VSELGVRRASGAADVDAIVDVLSEAARWLLARGIRQWPDPFPRDRVEALAERGDFYVGECEGQLVATIALLWDDPTFWGEQPPVAGYVHALAVRRAWAGRGIGERLLAWADEQIVRAGRELLRLDCVADNRDLRRYYERLGFEERGEAVAGDLVAMRFERRCSRGGRTITLPARSRDRHVAVSAIRSQRERGWPETPPNEGGGALGG